MEVLPAEALEPVMSWVSLLPHLVSRL